jgi:quercetin dioxygenase-like cupin family protein
MKKLLVCSLFTCIVFFQHAFAKPIEANEVLKTTHGWTGAALPGYPSGQTELRVVSYKIAPGAKTSVHVHPVNGAGYMTSGELTMYASATPDGDFSDPTKVKKLVLKAGDAWAEAVNIWHYGENNGDKAAEFVVIYSATPGTPSALSRP